MYSLLTIFPIYSSYIIFYSGWLPETSVYAYKKNLNEFTSKTVKTSGFKEALEEIAEEYDQLVKESGGEPDEFEEADSGANTSAKAAAAKRPSPAAVRRPSNQSASLLDDSAANADSDYVPIASTSRSSAGTSRQPPKKRRINASTGASSAGEDPFEYDDEHTSPKRAERERDVSDEEADVEMLTNGAAEAAPATIATAPSRVTSARRGRGRGRSSGAAAAAAAAPSDARRSTSPTAAATAAAVSSVKRGSPATSSLAAAMAKSQSSATQSQSAAGAGRSRLSPTTSFLMSASAQSGVGAKAKRSSAAAAAAAAQSGSPADIRTTQSGTIMIDDYLAANRPLAFIFDNTNALSLAILARLATQLGGSHPILAYPCKPVGGHKSSLPAATAASASGSNAGHKDALLNGDVAAGEAEKEKEKTSDKEQESATLLDTDVTSASAGAPAATQDIDTSKQSSQQESYATPVSSSARSPSAATAAAGASGTTSLAEAIGSPELGEFFRGHNVDAVDDLGLLFQKSELIFVSCPDASFLESVCAHAGKRPHSGENFQFSEHVVQYHTRYKTILVKSKIFSSDGSKTVHELGNTSTYIIYSTLIC